MTRLPHTILILFCTVFIAADQPQKSSATHEKVAKAFYAQVRKAAESEEKAAKRESKALSSKTPLTPKTATGVIVDRQGKPIPGAGIVIEHGSTREALGEGKTDASGRFQITLSTRSYKGLVLTVTKDGFKRWALGGIYGGIVDQRVRLDREIDEGFLKRLIVEQDQERRLWMLLEIVGDRQFAATIGDLFPHMGMLRLDLLRLVQSKAFEATDGGVSPPADKARSFLAYWHDPADERVFRQWLNNQKRIEKPPGKMLGSTIAEVCQLWADHHFGGKKPEDRTFHQFNKPFVDPSGNHALVQFWIEYKHWGYSQRLVLTREQVKWHLRFVADDMHWHKDRTADATGEP